MTVFVETPATLANVGPGFDVLGMAFDGPVDRVGVELLEATELRVSCCGPFGDRIPEDPDKNVAAFAARRVLASCGVERGVHLTVEKVIPPGSGMGSSAASSVAAAVATMRAIGHALSTETLLAITRDAEGLAAGSPHMDNVAPALLGGLVAVLDSESPRVARFSVPSSWVFAVILPHVEVRTEQARAVLPKTVPRGDAIVNLRNLVGVLDAVHRADLDQFNLHLEDRLALPYRRPLLPFLDEAQQAARSVAPVALQISGSGPAMFAACPDDKTANDVCAAVQEQLVRWHLESTTFVGPARSHGAL